MKFTIKLLIVLIVAIAGLTWAQNGKEPSATKAPITAFVNVKVVPMDRERIIENQTVIVRAGRIAEIGAANKIQVPDGAQAPDGRWDGTITYGTLNVPFTIHFEPNGKTLRGSFVNGDTRVSSTEGSFEAGSVRLTFGASGRRLEAKLVDGQLNGTIGSGGQDLHPFTASKYCSCNIEGDAGPEISGTWEVPDSDWRLTIRRKGDDTLATVSRPSGELGPLAGRFDGLIFALHYFDGVRAAALEIEQRKDGGLDLKLTEPGTDVKKYRAVQATTRK